MSLSLRELFAFVVCVAIGLAVLIKATAWSANLLMLVVLLSWIGCLIAVVTTKGRFRHFALGYVLACGSFAVVNWGDRYTSGDAVFPDSIIVQDLYVLLTGQDAEVFSGITWSPYSPYQPATAPPAWPATAPPAWVVPAPNLPPQITPAFSAFAAFSATLHQLVALTFGYLGGKFAVFIARRDDRTPSANN